MRPAGARGQVRPSQGVGGHRVGRHARARVQLQHARARPPVRGPLGLPQVFGYIMKPKLSGS